MKLDPVRARPIHIEKMPIILRNELRNDHLGAKK